MRRTNHALLAEGKPYIPGDEIPWVRVPGGEGVAICQCGRVSPELPSDAARKRWHADHKAEVRAAQATREAQAAVSESLRERGER